MTLLKKLTRPPFFQALILLWLTILAYCIYIPWFGLYADDWPFLYVYDAAGLMGVVRFVQGWRPLAGWFFGGIVALFGQTFWAYHLFVALLRWADALLFMLVFKRVFPGYKMAIFWAAAVMVVYPAFKQQPLSVEYFPHFAVLALMMFSFWCMVRGVDPGNDGGGGEKRAWTWRVLGWVTAFNYFFMEYFTGLELLRPLFLWVVLGRKGLPLRRRIGRVLLEWAPYLGIFGFFVLWKMVLAPSPNYAPQLLLALAANPLDGVLALVQKMGTDLFTLMVRMWVQVFTFPAGGRTLLLYLGVVLAAFVTVGAGLWFNTDDAPRKEMRAGLKDGLWIFLIGLFIFLISGSSAWVPLLEVSLIFPWDRMALPFMVGVSLMTAGLVQCIRHRLAQTLALTLLVSFSIGLHFQNANAYRREWEIFKDYFWQISWRMPGLEPGTLISDYEPQFNYHTDKFLNTALNWTYRPGVSTLEQPYSFYDFYKLQPVLPSSPKQVIPVRRGYGSLSFDGSSDQVLLTAYYPPGCFTILTSGDDGAYPLSEEMKKALPFSNLDVIETAPPVPARPPVIWGEEPAHTWCYSFEKASLARQKGDWDEVARLGNEARQKGYQAGNPAEWIVFIEGSIRSGRMEVVQEMIDRLREKPEAVPALCRRLKAMQKKVPEAGKFLEGIAECR